MQLFGNALCKHCITKLISFTGTFGEDKEAEGVTQGNLTLLTSQLAIQYDSNESISIKGTSVEDDEVEGVTKGNFCQLAIQHNQE